MGLFKERHKKFDAQVLASVDGSRGLNSYQIAQRVADIREDRSIFRVGIVPSTINVNRSLNRLKREGLVSDNGKSKAVKTEDGIGHTIQVWSRNRETTPQGKK